MQPTQTYLELRKALHKNRKKSIQVDVLYALSSGENDQSKSKTWSRYDGTYLLRSSFFRN